MRAGQTGKKMQATSEDGAVFRPIGRLRTPWAATGACPRNGRQPDPRPVCRAEVFEAFAPGLQDLAGFSHLILLYWLDQARAPDLVFTPPFDGSPRGVFATRAPWRPNPIGLSVVSLDGIEGSTLLVRNLDCVDGTPLLDIKPYLRTTDAEPAASLGWLAPHAGRRAAG